MYILYILFDLLLSLDVLGGIIYWIMLFFAPFSLLDCFVKIAGVQLGLTDETSPSKLNLKRYLIKSNHILSCRSCFSFRDKWNWCKHCTHDSFRNFILIDLSFV